MENGELFDFLSIGERARSFVESFTELQKTTPVGDIPSPLVKDLEEYVDTANYEWVRGLLKSGEATVREVLRACDALKLKKMKVLIAAAMADILKHEPRDRIKEYLGIPADAEI